MQTKRTDIEIIREIQETKKMSLEQIYEAVNLIPEMKSLQEFLEIYEEDNLAIFPDYVTFFYWLHQECTQEELIQFLLDGVDYTQTAMYVELKSGHVVFIYQ